MANHVITDITACQYGTVKLERAVTARIYDEVEIVDSDPGHLAGSEYSDHHVRTIKANVSTQDPFALPLLLALSGGQTFKLGGREINTTNYHDETLLNALLLGYTLKLTNGRPGTLDFDLQNRAATASTGIADEWTTVAGAKQSITTRRTSLNLRAEVLFTDDAEEELSIPGLAEITFQRRPRRVVSLCSNPAADKNVLLADIVDVSQWEYSGSIRLLDGNISSSKRLAARLVEMRRGTLVVPCRLMGYEDDDAAPADKVVTFERVKFNQTASSRQSGSEWSNEIPFRCTVLAAGGASELTAAEMVTMEDASSGGD